MGERERKVPWIVRGQRVGAEKVERAKQLRWEMTPAEAVLWRELRTNRFHGLHFRRQQVIDGFIVDFYCRTARLVIEVDGAIHDEQRESDAERDQVLADRNLLVLRFTNNEVIHELPTVLTRIKAVADTRTTPPSFIGKGVGGLG